MSTHATPGDGDIIVREVTREGTRLFVLQTGAGVGQYLMRRREDAVRYAVTFATRKGVRAWLAGEAEGFVPLQDVQQWNLSDA